MIVAVISKKGGVGKTTSAVSLSSALAARGRKVLLIDLDPQASSSLSLGIPRSGLAPSVADVLLSGMPAIEAIRRDVEPGLDLLTSSTDLLDADYSLASLRRREQVLRDKLEPVADSYDYVLIDCAPALTTLPANAIVASDVFLIPTTAQFLSTEGVANLVRRAERVADRNQSKSRLFGILLTMVDYRTRATREHVDSLRACFGDQVFAIEIRVNVRLSEAPEAGHSIFCHDPKSTGAKAYNLLADEFLLRAQDELLTEQQAAEPADETAALAQSVAEAVVAQAHEPPHAEVETGDHGASIDAQPDASPAGHFDTPSAQSPEAAPPDELEEVGIPASAPTETGIETPDSAVELAESHASAEPEGERVRLGWHNFPLTTN